jgi:hypothetical protein
MFAFLKAGAQQPVINYTSEGSSLSSVLEEISTQYHLKFAFNSGSFQSIKTNFTLEAVPLDEFLQLLEEEYHIRSKNIDGTWVLVAGLPAVSQKKINQPETYVLSGFVKDRTTGENLIYCNVATSGNRGGMTNELGFFSFEMPATDSVLVSVSYVGFQRLDTLVAPAKNMVFELEPLEIVLDPVQVIHFEKEVLQASPYVDRISFNPMKSSEIPRISNDDLGNALLIIPGVNFLQGGMSGLSIRGSSPTDNLVLLDGIPVLETNHLLGNMSVLNSKFVNQAFVSRGGFDAAYGGRVAGLIQITGKSGENKNPYLDISANLLNTNVLASVPLSEKFSVTAAWRRSFIDQWQNYLYYRLIDDVIASEENQVTSSIIPTVKYNDVNAKISFHPSEKLEFNLNFLYGNDEQSRDFELIQTSDYYRNERTHGKNTGVSFNWKWQANDNWFHSLSAGMSTLESERVDETGELQEVTEIIENPGQGVGKGKGLAKTKERTFTREVFDIDNGSNYLREFRSGWKTTFKKGIFDNEAGVGITANQFTYDFYAERTEAEIEVDAIASESTLEMMNAFFQQRINLNEQFHFRWGLRTNIDLASGKTFWQPRGGLEFHPVSGLKIYALSGVYYQFLSGIKRFDSQGYFNQIWYLPDDDGRGIVKSDHYIGGIKYENRGWFIDFEAYLKNASGRVNLFAEEVRRGNNLTVSYLPYETEEKNQGLDLFIQKKQRHFNHMISYSMSSSEVKTEGILGGEWFPDYNDRPHRLKVTEMVKWQNWTLTGSWQLASGLPVLNLSASDNSNDFQRSDYFSQLDFALSKKVVLSRFVLNGGVSMLNVFNRENVVEVNYLRFSSESGFMTVRSDISALGFTPVFFMNVRFQ